MARPPAPPPRIPGFTFIKALGQGGFADVYLFQQDSPRRVVAVKVLIAEMAGTEAAVRLNREADAMAGLSQHQNIVTVFQSGVAEDGRAYMVMEYYPRPALSQGLRTSQRSLASALSIGIQLAGAVESAHRLGILHRDIKPANILVDRAGRPVLGDFGIAMTSAEAALGGAQGMSIPYSPPEAFDANPRPVPQSDVWGLAATVYALLTGRTPFEEPGGDNRPHIMVERIKHDPYRPLGRQDAPPSLDQVLATAMAKAPQSRYDTMQAFGRALGEVEQELHLNNTPMDIIDPNADGDYDSGEDDGAGTRLRPITMIDPTGATTGSRPPSISVTSPTNSVTGSSWPGTSTTGSGTLTSRTQSYISVAPATLTPQLGDEVIDRTQLHADAVEPPPEESQTSELSAPAPAPWRRVIVVVIAVVVAVAVAVVVWQSRGTPPAGPATSVSQSVIPQDPIGADVPQAPVDLVGTLDETNKTATFTWVNPDPQSGDSYRWSVVGDPDTKSTAVSTTSVSAVPVPAGQVTVCISVRVVRAGKGSAATTACAA